MKHVLFPFDVCLLLHCCPGGQTTYKSIAKARNSCRSLQPSGHQQSCTCSGTTPSSSTLPKSNNKSVCACEALIGLGSKVEVWIDVPHTFKASSWSVIESREPSKPVMTQRDPMSQTKDWPEKGPTTSKNPSANRWPSHVESRKQ